MPDPREPTDLPVLIETTVRGRRFKVYIRGGWGGDMSASSDELELNGHLVTDEELDQGWVVAGEWLPST